jgi:glycosyltransferase involved in cell wall biosynthesis
VTTIGIPCESATEDRGNNEEIRARYGIANKDFVFLNVSDALSHVSRKNPIGAIRAFVAAFPNNNDVRLVIKTHNMQHVTNPDQQRRWAAIRDVIARDGRIILMNETFSHEQHHMLIEASDCLVSLHRAEGFGLDLLYAVSRGVPVIATAYSGNMDFCNSDTVWLIDFQESYVGGSEYAFVRPGHKWVIPDHDAAVAALREIVANTVKRETLAHNGRRFVSEHFSPEVISARISHRLKEIFVSRASMR